MTIEDLYAQMLRMFNSINEKCEKNQSSYESLDKQCNQNSASVESLSKEVKSNLPSAPADPSLAQKINAIESAATTVSSINDVTNKLTSDFKDTKEEVTTLEQDLTELEGTISDLTNRYPTVYANRPSFTPIPIVSQQPSNVAFQLSSKTVNIKNLSRELAQIKFPDDNINTIFTNYSRISQAIDIACSTSSLLPRLNAVTAPPDFYAILVPASNHTFFHSIYNSYLSVSTALYNYFSSPETLIPKLFKAFKHTRKFVLPTMVSTSYHPSYTSFYPNLEVLLFFLPTSFQKLLFQMVKLCRNFTIVLLTFLHNLNIAKSRSMQRYFSKLTLIS